MRLKLTCDICKNFLLLVMPSVNVYSFLKFSHFKECILVFVIEIKKSVYFNHNINVANMLEANLLNIKLL